jgi:hypothetical protein
VRADEGSWKCERIRERRAWEETKRKSDRDGMVRGPMWRAKVKICKSSVLRLVFREFSDSSQAMILWPQENKTEINTS